MEVLGRSRTQMRYKYGSSVDFCWVKSWNRKIGEIVGRKKIQHWSQDTTVCKHLGGEEPAKKMRSSSQEKTRGQEDRVPRKRKYLVRQNTAKRVKRSEEENVSIDSVNMEVDCEPSTLH